MPQMVDVKCKCGCGRFKSVRVADRKRGWGKYFSKSCKAIHQAKKNKASGGRGRTLSKEKRYQHLCEALEDGRISEEYFNIVAIDEYSEFMTDDERIQAELDSVGTFGSEEAVQGGF